MWAKKARKVTRRYPKLAAKPLCRAPSRPELTYFTPRPVIASAILPKSLGALPSAPTSLEVYTKSLATEAAVAIKA